ncbi:MAG: CarD family transcriptional regulator, partial [Chloroflexota bacterium]
MAALESGDVATACTDESKTPLIAAVATGRRAPVLVLTARTGRAAQLAEQIQTWAGNGVQTVAFPEPDVLPYERLNPDPRIVRDRLAVLHALGSGDAQPCIVVASIGAVATPTLAAGALREVAVSFARGEVLAWEAVGQRWLRLGYEPVATVEAPGQFARRGGIIDCFPPGMEEPFRLELFGNEIDNIRLFDPLTQRSTEMVDSVSILPARELLGPPWSEPHHLDLSGCTPEAQRRFETDVPRLMAGGAVNGFWYYAPLFNRASLLDHLPGDSIVVLDEPGELGHALADLRDQAGKLRAQGLADNDLPNDFPDPLWEFARLEQAWRRHHVLTLTRWESEELVPEGFSPAPGYAGRLKSLFSDLRTRQREGCSTVLVSDQSERLADLLAQEGIEAVPQESIGAPPEPGNLTLVHGALPGGWALAGASGVDRLLVLTDAELFGFVKERRRRVSSRGRARENPLLGLTPGEHVVHVEHGIGRFRGMVTMEQQAGGGREYLHLEYADRAALYVPADQVDRVARYIGPGGHDPALSRLGTQEWERAKERVKKAAVVSAKELLDTVVARQVQLGRATGPDTVWQQELEASFPYVETADQMNALRDVKGDMETPRPMDRLVCGDVGYGKTEV